jgi:hypothetical protein
MAPAKKKGKPAPASKTKPVVPEVLAAKEAAKVARAEKKEEERLARVAKRAERSAANKAAYAASKVLALAEARSSIESLRALAGRKFGTPSLPWTEELGDRLFELIATGHSMDEIGRMDDMPSVFHMLKWRQDETHPFCLLFTRAKQQLVDLYEERAQLAALQPETFVQKTRKQVVTRDGDIVWVTENRIIDNVARSALKFQAYQWTLAHLRPKKHGRNPDPSTGSANEQLKGMLEALKQGPIDGQG